MCNVSPVPSGLERVTFLLVVMLCGKSGFESRPCHYSRVFHQTSQLAYMFQPNMTYIVNSIILIKIYYPLETGNNKPSLYCPYIRNMAVMGYLMQYPSHKRGSKDKTRIVNLPHPDAKLTLCKWCARALNVRATFSYPLKPAALDTAGRLNVCLIFNFILFHFG